ncbi:RNHCP domain-containing protein [Candidatus Peregrinibacteria bacterium]|nr:MAG: RNHCP domain-containing protein [Candidatus Peregrinibacteria bacterium]
MNFIVINQPFQCLNCGAQVPRQEGSCRNHCKSCLYSQHVDAEFPGDRASNCGALMAPIGLTQSGKKGWILLHKCTKCFRIVRNKLADDDNMDLAIALSRNPI